MTPNASAPQRPFLSSSSLLLWLLLLGASFSLQHHNGAYRSEFAGHPDEAAHVVTSLMIRDYLVDGLPALQSPISFAKDYYERFPKVALGHYPPGFYLAASIPLAISRSPAAILFFMALLQATAAWLVWFAGRRFLQPVSAILAAFTFILLPLSQKYTALVMSDMLLVAGVLLSAIAFTRFLDHPTVRSSLAFGFLAAATILTKGSGILLALLPPFALILTGKFRLIRDYRLWLGALPVLILAAPWTVVSSRITAEGMGFDSLSSYITAAIPYYSSITPQVFGWTAIVFCLVGLVMVIARRLRGYKPAPFPACIWSAGLAVLAIYLVVPSGTEPRYLLPLAPAMLLGLASSGEWLGKKVGTKLPFLGTPTGASPKRATAIGGSLALLATLATHHKIDAKTCHGMTPALAAMATACPAPPKGNKYQKVLISSDARGEGALTAAAAFDRQHPWRILRGSKVLSTSDWHGRGYKLAFEGPEELVEFLREEDIAWVIIDESIPEDRKTTHHQQLPNAAQKFPALFTAGPAATFSRSSHQAGALQIFSIQPDP